MEPNSDPNQQNNDMPSNATMPEDPRRPKKQMILWVVGLLFVAAIIGIGIWLMASSKEEPVVNTSASMVEQGWSISSAKASVPRTEVSAALYQGKVYVVGGYNEAGQAVNTVEIFDPQTDSWSQGPALPSAVHHTSAVVLGGQLFVVGGLTGTDSKPTNKVYAYDGTKWTEGPMLPQPLGAQGAAIVSADRLYVAGGIQADGASTGAVYSLGVDETEWRTEPSMTAARNHLTLASVDGKLYAIGGRDSETMTLQTVEIYDPLTKQWQAGADMPTGRSGLTSAVLAGKIYAFGGESTEKTFSEAEEYNPASGTWREITPMPEARHGLGSAVFGNTIFLFLGGPEPGLTVSDNVQILGFTAEE